MNKQSALQQIREEAFWDEMEKVAGDVQIPSGGLRSGWFGNDLTQTMNEEDAKKVKSKFNFFQRTGPGIVPSSVVGAISGGAIHGVARAIKTRSMSHSPYGLRGALIGAAVGPAWNIIATKAGLYDKQALKAAKKLVEKSN